MIEWALAITFTNNAAPADNNNSADEPKEHSHVPLLLLRMQLWQNVVAQK